ncbi:MAG: uS15 family ribosomal protein [Candidatus Shikimatogenerans bostrichidophilus]|nr:MAG: uS15 family ribosomal protein [Candidatus Shikimatogenerans bostrichidophilus]
MKNKINKKYYINQIVLLTTKIYNLSKHLKKNNKDYNTERTLLKIVNKRKKNLKYIKKKDINLYLQIKEKFKIRK